MKANKQKDNDVAVMGFESKYPPNFKGTVALDPSKNYSATSAGGRMNFAYDGVDAGVGAERDTPDEPAAQSLEKVAKVISGEPTTSPATKTRKVGDVGRKKR